jgi:site-specific DNA-methyltransferase (adenine-specific)
MSERPAATQQERELVAARGVGAAERTGRKRSPTATSSFGVGRRENHDSAAFYARFAAPALSNDAVVSPPGVVDQVYVGDSRSMDRVQPASVALVVTSPPYFAGKQYE